MRIFKIVSCLALWLLSLDASAAGWVSVEPDHFNLLYSVGESAEFKIVVLNQPVNPAFQVLMTMEYVGVAGPVALAIENGIAVYRSPSLIAGAPEFHLITHLMGPESLDLVVDDETFALQVN